MLSNLEDDLYEPNLNQEIEIQVTGVTHGHSLLLSKSVMQIGMLKHLDPDPTLDKSEDPGEANQMLSDACSSDFLTL